jgi:hypothetical protein
MPTDEEILSAFGTTQKSPSDDDILAAFGTPVKKKESAVKSEPSGSDLVTPSSPLEKSGESKSFTERIATNDLPKIPEFKTKGESVLEQPKQKTPLDRIKEVKSSVYPELDRFYKENPHVAGMNHTKGEVSRNPYSKLPEKNIQYIIDLEKTRDIMSNDPDAPKPTFKITDEQRKYFESIKDKNPNTVDYHDTDDDTKRQTIASRLYVGDEMNGIPFTKEQEEYVNKLHKYSTSPQETKSFTEKIATNDLPQTFAKQQTKGKSDAEILSEKKSQTQIAQEAHKKVRQDAMSEQKPLFGEIAEYVETVRTAIEKGWKQGELTSKINEVASAQANAKMAKDFDFTPESYQKMYDEKVTQLGNIQKDIESVQSSKSVKKYEEAKDNQEAWEAFKENPIDIITNLALSSAASLFSNTLNSKSDGGDPVLGNMIQVPAPTIPLLMAEKSYQLGMSSDVIGALQESGVDLKNPKSVKDAIGDDQKMAEIYSNARKRNIPIAIVDAVTGSIASKVTKAIPKKAVGVVAGLGVEATGGAAGEALGQLNSGQKLDAKSILEEAAGEVGAGAPNVASSFINTENGTVPVQEPTQQSTTNTEGAKPSNVIAQQQESVVQSVSPEANQGVVQITKVEERSVPEITQMTGSDVEALVQERLNPTKEDANIQSEGNQGNKPVAIQETGSTGIQEPDNTTGVQAVSENIQETGTPNAEGVPIGEEGEQNNITNEPTQEQDIQASVLDQSGTTDSNTEKGTRQTVRKPNQEKITEKLSKGLSVLGKLSEDKKRVKTDGVFVKEKRLRNKKIQQLDPTNATQAARQYLLEKGKLDTKSIQYETGMSPREMNQLIGIYGTSKSHPNLEKASENILSRHEYLKDQGVEPQDVRNALIDLLSSDRTKWHEDQYNELDPDKLRQDYEASQIPEDFEYENVGFEAPNDEVAQSHFDSLAELSDEDQKRLQEILVKEYENGNKRDDVTDAESRPKSEREGSGADNRKQEDGTRSNGSRTSTQRNSIQKRYGNNSKSSEEVVSEINSKPLTRVEGLNMGQSQARGTYVSTEAKNRYETADKKAKKAKVKLSNPFVFKSETGIHQLRNDILREQIEQPGSIFEEIDFANYKLPDPWDNVTIDDLSDSGIVKLAGFVSDKLIEEGYDSIYWPETKTHEGELVVFDRENVEIEGELSPKDKLALGVEALANIYGITKNAKQSDINTKQALNLIAEGLYDQLGVTGNALIKAIKDYLKENKIDNLNGEVDKFKVDILNGIEEYKNTVDIQDYVSEIKVKQQEKKSLLNRAYKGQTETKIKEAIAQYGLTYAVEGHAEAKAIADGIISDIGLDNAIEAVNRFEVQGAPAAFILSRGIESLQAEILKTENSEQAQKLIQEQAQLINSLDIMGRTGGRFSSALYEIYKNSDFNFDLERQIKQYKDANNGEIPKSVEDKMIYLDNELKAVAKKLIESEEKVRLLEQQAAVEAIKADITKSVVKRQRMGKTLIAEGLDEIAEALGITLMASGDKRASVINGLAKIGRGMIEEGVATIDNVAEKLREFVAKKLNGKVDFVEYQDDVIEAINTNPEIRSGRIKIKQATIRKLVEEGANTIDDLVAKLTPIVKKEYLDATEREIRDAVTSYGKVLNPQRDEIDIKIGKMKRIGRLISALEDVRNKKRPLKSGLQREKMDADERALNKALREAMKELPMDLEAQEKQLKTILDSTKQRLRNQIEDLNREIATKEQVPKSAKVFRSDEEIEELKKQRDALKKQHDEVFKNDDYKDRLRLDIAKRNAEKKIADFQRRIKERDLAVKKRTQVEADKELNKLKIKQLELKDEFVKLQYENELKNRTRRQKVIDGLFEAWGLTRALRATGEMSFILLQGGVQSIAHPVTAAKALTTAMSHFASETRSENWLRELRAKEQYMIMKESKLALAEPNAKLTVREEQFLGGWVNHIWDFGGYPLKMAGEKTYENWKKANPIKAIERAGVGYMNTLRVERFLQGEIMLQEQGKTIRNNKEDYKNMADVINTLTGRGSIGALEGSAKVWSSIFFSPRNWASTIKTATPYAFYHFGKMTTKNETGKTNVSVAQKMAVRDFMTFVGATGAIVALASVALNNDDDDETGVEFDPTSSDFMKIKLGNTRVDPWGGKIQQVILMSRIMTQSMKKENGKIQVLGYGGTSNSGELAIKMATNKFAPSMSMLYKLAFADKKKVNGKYVLHVPFEGEYDATEQLAANLYPIYWDSIKETYKEQPEVLASFLSALAFMGMGVNTYSQKEKKKSKVDK